jgi:Ser-tRNA(Ala) deacylase AlaX
LSQLLLTFPANDLNIYLYCANDGVETEKNSYSLICTSRRCKLLQDALPKEEKTLTLSFEFKNKPKYFDFKISKTQFNFEKQSSSNNYIIDEQISSLCKNISTIKVSMKDLITLVYNKFIEKFENSQKIIESIIPEIPIVKRK